jgi:hypothetical protein
MSHKASGSRKARSRWRRSSRQDRRTDAVPADLGGRVHDLELKLLQRRPCLGKGFAGHQGIGLPCGFEPRERLAECTLDIEQRRLVALLGGSQLGGRSLLL